MGKNKQVTCKVCYRDMRSNNLKRHLKVHLKFQPVTKSNEEMCRELMLELVDEIVDPVQEDTERKEKHANSAQEHSERKRKFAEPSKIFNNNPDLEKLEKAALQKQEEYEEKVNLGKKLYTILDKGVVTEESFPNDWKDALDIYMKQGTEIDCENVELKPWQTELMKLIKNPTDRHVIWVVGTACGEGKTFFQKYVRSMFGRKRVVANGINIKSNSASICHALSKRPLATTDIFMFNIGKSSRRMEEVNYEMLEDLKDGDAFASKYNSQELKIKVPNVVIVFSNDWPKIGELADDRWKIFRIVDDELIEERIGHVRYTNLPKKDKKEKRTYQRDSEDDDY